MKWLKTRNSIVDRRCPSCIVGTLTRNEGGVWVCDNDDRSGEGFPEDRCKFVIEDSAVGLPRISVGAIGVPMAGKTIWCAVLVRDLQHAPAYACTRLKSPKREESVFLDSIKAIEMGSVPVATGLSLHQPETLRVATHDSVRKPQKSAVFVRDAKVLSYLRGGPSETPGIERFLYDDDVILMWNVFCDYHQSEAFSNFWAMRQASPKGVPSSVAIAVHCIDLFQNTHHADQSGFRNGKLFVDELRRITECQPPSMELIEQRHRLTMNFLRSNGFGHKVDMYAKLIHRDAWRLFPMSCLGFAEDHDPIVVSDGIGSPNRRSKPFAVVEPLLWLLHRRGFPALW